VAAAQMVVLAAQELLDKVITERRVQTLKPQDRAAEVAEVVLVLPQANPLMQTLEVVELEQHRPLLELP